MYGWQVVSQLLLPDQEEATGRFVLHKVFVCYQLHLFKACARQIYPVETVFCYTVFFLDAIKQVVV
jgi:hypothetical protein